MSDEVRDRLAALGLTLPAVSVPAANYLPYRRHGNLVFISGQLCVGPNGLNIKGKLGDNVSLEEGREAARLCALNILAQAEAVLEGDLDSLDQVLRITGYVASAPSFTDQHLVVNGASDLLVEVLGEHGRHSRAAVGMACLPLDAAVEVDAIIAVA